MSDLSSPNHGLDSPMSDDYSTASTGVLDTHSLSGIGSGDALTSHFKSKYERSSKDVDHRGTNCNHLSSLILQFSSIKTFFYIK